MKKMTPEKFAQFVYDTWVIPQREFRTKYGVEDSYLWEEAIMEQAVLQGAIPTEED